MARPAREATRERVIEAAAQLFAERGFRGATMRAIAERAGANLASAHYHFGSKQKLYLEVVASLFLALEGRLEERGLSPSEGQLAESSRSELAELLRARIETLLESLLESPGLHGTLILRELCDPTPALQELVRRFIDPMRREMEVIVRHLEPALSADDAAGCVRSIAGQVFFYRTHRPALLQMMARRAYPRGFEREVSAHVLAFSLGGIEAVAGRSGARKDDAKEARCGAAS